MRRQDNELKKPSHKFFDSLTRYVREAWGDFVRQPVVWLLNTLLNAGVLALFSGLSAIGLAFVYAEDWSFGSTVNWVRHNKRDFVLFVTLSFLGLAALRSTWIRVASRWSEIQRFRRASRSMGLIDSFDPNAEGAGAQWEHCAQYIAETSPTELLILGATGWNTFADDNAPLHSTLDSFTGNLRILLVAPGSEAAEIRANEIAIGPTGAIDHSMRRRILAEFEDEITKTIAYCKRLADKPSVSLRSIEVRGYVEKPIWKLVFANKYVWVQHYRAGVHVAETPGYLFSRPHPYLSSFFQAYLTVFQRRWRHPTTMKLVERT